MSNFSDFIKNKSTESGCKKEENLNKKYSEQNLQDMISKYSNYSEDRLLGEFIKLTLEKKKKGELTDLELNNIKSTILPFLNQEQKENLNKILDMVRNV